MNQRHSNGASGNGMPDGTNGSRRGHPNNGHPQPPARTPSISRGGSPHPHPHPQGQPQQASNGAQNGASSGGAARAVSRERTRRTPSPQPSPAATHEAHINDGARMASRWQQMYLKGFCRRLEWVPDASGDHFTATISGRGPTLQRLYGEQGAGLLDRGVIPTLPATASSSLRAFTSGLFVVGHPPDSHLQVRLSRQTATSILGREAAAVKLDARPASYASAPSGTGHPLSLPALGSDEVGQILEPYFRERKELAILQSREFTRTSGNGTSVQVTTLLSRRLADNIIGWETVEPMKPGVVETWTHTDLPNIDAKIEKTSEGKPGGEPVRVMLTLYRERVKQFVKADGITRLFGPSVA